MKRLPTCNRAITLQAAFEFALLETKETGD
jgi:hypothetical protein